MVSTSFFADGEVYDTALVETNEHPASTEVSQAPASFFADGAVYDTAEVISNDTPGNNAPSSAPSSFYPGGNIYDFLSQESAIVELLQALAATTTTNANAASSSASQASTSASQAATSASQAATVVATAVQSAAGTATPLIDGTAAVGTSTKWAHEDHVHPTDTSRASVTALNAAVAPKADTTYVDTQDAAGKSYTDTKVAPKADKTYVDTQDALKADKTYVDTQDATKVALAGNQNITGGYTITAKALGNLASFTPNPLLGNYQYGTNVGALTITAPSTDCAVDIVVTNSATAGAIGFSGFRGGLTGDPLTTTNGSKFLISIRRIGGDSMYIIKALQ